jgi:hypothetical protein
MDSSVYLIQQIGREPGRPYILTVGFNLDLVDADSKA